MERRSAVERHDVGFFVNLGMGLLTRWLLAEMTLRQDTSGKRQISKRATERCISTTTFGKAIAGDRSRVRDAVQLWQWFAWRRQLFF